MEQTQKGMDKTGVGRKVAVFCFGHKGGSLRHMESIGAYKWDDLAVEA